MISKIVFTFVLIAVLAPSQANEEPQFDQTKVARPSDTVGFEINKGYDFKGGLDGKARPHGYVKLFGGAKVGPGPQTTPYSQNEYFAATSAADSGSQQPQQYWLQQAQPTSLWAGQTGTILTGLAYFIGGVAAAVSVWYSCAFFSTSFKRSVDELEDTKTTKKTSEEKATKASRKRRAIAADEQLTNLASMVLAAVESGECLQKSICLMGSSVSTGKGRLAASLLDKMVPESVQASPYFVILRNSLKGEAYCNKMRCKH